MDVVLAGAVGEGRRERREGRGGLFPSILKLLPVGQSWVHGGDDDDDDDVLTTKEGGGPRVATGDDDVTSVR